MKRKTLFSGMILCFFLGIFFFDFFRNDILLSIPILFCFLFLTKLSPRVIFLWNMSFLLGMIRVFLSISEPNPNEIHFFASKEKTSEKVEIIGVISDFPDIRTDKTKVSIAVESIQLPDKTKRNVNGKILVNIPKYPEVSYGDRIQIYGSLQIPPEWEDFSYQRFLEKEGISSYVPWAQFEVVESHKGSQVFAFLFSLRSKIENTLRQKIPEPEASFAVGILLGGERGFSDEIIEEFRITGLSHLLALSGSNITILILFVFWLCQFFPKMISLGFTLIFVTSFVLLTGGDASVVRAAVMGMIALFVLHFGQEGNALYILLWSMLLMILWNPFLLLSDVSFQLSVAAVIGLILFVPVWQRFFRNIPEILGFREAMQTTLAAQITAIPLVAFYFKRVSLISPIANLLVAPCIPLAMLFSFLSLFPLIGNIFAFLAYGVLHIALSITHFLAVIPLADISFSLGIIGITTVYIGVGILWWRSKKEI